MDLDCYRRRAEQFVCELTAEFYRHYAGLKDEYAIEPIYQRHAGLFTGEAVDWLRTLLGGAEGDGDRRSLRMLLDFAAEGYVGQASKHLEAQLATREAALSIEVGGQRVGYRASAAAQANEPDRERRQLIEEARLAALERHLGPLYRELLERQHAASRELGWASYRQMCSECKALNLHGLHSETAAFAAATEERYPEVMEPAVQRTLGIPVEQLRRSDLPRLLRAAHQDRHFPAEKLIAALVDTLTGLGIDMPSQTGVILDLEERANKSPRAFCAPVRVPDEVYLVVARVGGWEDFAALFHEGGHTEHYAHVDPSMPFEYRYLGDNAITESFAFLFQHLVEEPAWLERRLRVDEADVLAEHACAQRLLYLRRYGAKLAYELELHEEGPSDALAERYATLLGGALHIEWPPQTSLSDVDPGFYCACYLRAWALEAYLRSYLRASYGEAWFEVPQAGDDLKELWREGQRLSPEELLAELTSEKLEFAVLAEQMAP